MVAQPDASPLRPEGLPATIEEAAAAEDQDENEDDEKGVGAHGRLAWQGSGPGVCRIMDTSI